MNISVLLSMLLAAPTASAQAQLELPMRLVDFNGVHANGSQTLTLRVFGTYTSNEELWAHTLPAVFADGYSTLSLPDDGPEIAPSLLATDLWIEVTVAGSQAFERSQLSTGSVQSCVATNVLTGFAVDQDGDAHGEFFGRTGALWSGPPRAWGLSCTDEPGPGYGPLTDCDDADATIYPGANELCDRVDQDCNGIIDDNIEGGEDIVYEDLDGDGYGTGSGGLGCATGEDRSTQRGDCDDTNLLIHPDATETPHDDIDANCDGDVDPSEDVEDTGNNPGDSSAFYGGTGDTAWRTDQPRACNALPIPAAAALPLFLVILGLRRRKTR